MENMGGRGGGDGDQKDMRGRPREPAVTVCHVCGDRVRPQLYCPSCGHPLCGRCRKEPSPQNKQEMGSVNGDGGGEKHGQGGVGDEVERVSVAVATGLPSPAAATTPDGEGGGLVEVVRKSNGEIIAVEKRRPVKTNPFVIADQIARKVSDPQVSSTTIPVVAMPPVSKLPKYDLTTVVDRKRCVPVAPSDAAEHPRIQQSQREPHPERLSHSYASSSRGSSVVPPPSPGVPSNSARMLAAAEEREEERTAALQAKDGPHVHRPEREPDPTTPSTFQASNDRAHVLQHQARREKERTTPPVLRRVKVLAQTNKSGALQQVLQVDVDSGGSAQDNSGMETGGGRKSSGKSIPRARVTSPPAWLKGTGPFSSSSAASAASVAAQPGSIAGRLKKVGLDSSKTKSSPQLGQQSLGGKKKEGRGTTDSTATVTVVRPGGDGDARRGSNSQVSPGGLGRRGEGQKQQEQQLRSYPFPPGQQKQQSGGQQQHHSHESSGFWKVPSSVNMSMAAGAGAGARAASKATSEATIDGSNRLGGGGRRERSSVGGTATGPAGTGTVMVAGDEDDDVGIQGLTIVLHLRGKDDLVISTDLTREGGAGTEGGQEGTGRVLGVVGRWG
ncbi:uncharacterized protein QC763_702175 [Podospora pseudopauciseta]|uniref:B box-type domain-containing protein n=1 Tax=Podospora pseudopauciseta TaxID=2093780 RepID=A0ABR0H0G3_9PEZI|nr:hypothetical protein QC763_702175 [Podospora pseudopauciseta]